MGDDLTLDVARQDTVGILSHERVAGFDVGRQKGLDAADPPRSQRVADLLATLRGDRPVFYLPHLGNGGDALINVGFFDLARAVGLEVRVIDRTATLSRNDTLLIAGGGGLVPEYRFLTAVLPHFSKMVGTLVVLPQTAREQDGLLADLGSNVYLFLREHISYEYCMSVCRGATVLFDHDLAFNADLVALSRRRGFDGFRPSAINLARMLMLFALRRRARSNARLTAFRVGQEQAVPGRGRLATDVSKLTALGIATERQSYFAASQFVKTIDQFDEIHTDRLHMAIAAGMLGKRTVLYDNSYYKCRAVFEASMGAYPNVRMAKTDSKRPRSQESP